MKLLAMVTAAAVFAAWSFQASAQGDTETVKGHLIDVMCATKHAKEGSTYAEQHDKKCVSINDVKIDPPAKRTRIEASRDNARDPGLE